MFTSSFVVAILSAAMLARAEITPSEPSPLSVFNEGSQCHIAWTGDSDANSLWKTTNIELMTGANNKMVHLTTVTTVDGTTSGVFDYDCPDVTVPSNIYFYQFSSPATPNITWTGRFAIVPAGSQPIPATETNTPGSTDAVKWGTGALVDPSKASAAPSYLTGGSSQPASNPAGASATGSSTGSTAVTSPTASASLPNTNKIVTSSTPSASNANAQTSPSPSGGANGAMGGAAVDARVWQTLSALVVSAITFTVLL